MERVSDSGVIGSGGSAASKGDSRRRSSGAGNAAMPVWTARGIGEGRHSEEGDAVDRLPAGNNAPARRERYPEVNDYG